MSIDTLCVVTRSAQGHLNMNALRVEHRRSPVWAGCLKLSLCYVGPACLRCGCRHCKSRCVVLQLAARHELMCID
eukprot:6197411-Pleurochrysis_carterae.AAC.1